MAGDWTPVSIMAHECLMGMPYNPEEFYVNLELACSELSQW